jgi:asparagine synthase (glutamine-hydrolysing)
MKSGKNFDSGELSQARNALGTMRHRGPDAKGEWSEKNVFLGHNRLSIIDLSEQANQPFLDEEGRYVLVFNGEIYNYLELRSELIKLGAIFRTNSDTEVVLKSFIQYGPDAFLKFDGMFAIALFDRRQERLYLVRDFLGQKPLYYYDSPSGFVFASELRGILALPNFNWHANSENIYRFLFNSCFMGDMTPVTGIKKLLAGHYCVKGKQGTVIRKFWDSVPGEKVVKMDVIEARSQFEKLFDHSCKISMRSDVPSGIFLSGGMDSSLVLDKCFRMDPGISAFTVQMGELDFDESVKADEVCRHLGLSRINKYLMDSKALERSIDAYLDFLDEPHGDPGFVNAYFLAKSCCREIKVGLAGDGADELFAGYIPFKVISQAEFLNGLGRPAIEAIKGIVRKIVPIDDRYMSMQFKLLSFLDGFPSTAMTRLPLWLGAISPENLKGLCPQGPKDFFVRTGEQGTLLDNVCETLGPLKGRSAVDMGLYYYQKFFLPEFVCMHTDRAAMQNGLEVRSPFLSLPLIEFANQLPTQFKINDNQLKWLLRDSLRTRGYAPAICRQKKQGFTFPIARWMRTVMRSRLEKAFSTDRKIFSLIDKNYVDMLLQQHLGNQRNNYRILFNLLTLSSWLEKYPQVGGHQGG